MLLLLLGLVVLAALLITVVIDVSALFVARRDLLAAVDGAALAGAQEIDEATVYRDGVHGTLPLDPPGVQAAVDGYLRDSPASSQLTDLQWEVVTQGSEVHVLVVGQLHLPVVNSLVASIAGRDAVTVMAAATARSAVVP